MGNFHPQGTVLSSVPWSLVSGHGRIVIPIVEMETQWFHGRWSATMRYTENACLKVRVIFGISKRTQYHLPGTWRYRKEPTVLPACASKPHWSMELRDFSWLRRCSHNARSHRCRSLWSGQSIPVDSSWSFYLRTRLAGAIIKAGMRLESLGNW